MALTLAQIQANITNKMDARLIINQIADYLEANPPSSPGGSSYLVGDVTLDNDTILGMPDTLIPLVASLGAGKIPNFLWGYIIPNFTDVYGNLPDDESANIAFMTSNGSLDISNVLISVATLAYMFGTTDNPISFYSPVTFSGTGNAIFQGGLNDLENKGISLFLNTSNDHGDFTGGHANNTMRIIFGYNIVDL